MPDHPTVPLDGYQEYPPAEMLRRATEFADDIHRRRTVRTFSDRAVDTDVIRECIRAAGAAPSGANLQPWRFVVVTDPEVKRRIRLAAEEEEAAFYSGRAPDEWLEALAHLGTDAEKPFLERAPVLIAVFGESYGVRPDGEKRKNYYVTESVGLATGILIAALHRAGLATLTHTPSPMGFLNEVLGRGRNERAFVLLVVGFPESDTRVPDIARKPVEEIMSWVGPESRKGQGA
jgi:nitroreductase